MHKSWTNTTLGQLALAGGQLKVNVNSAARAARARTLVERLLEDNAKYRVSEITSAEAMLAEAKSRPAPKGESEHERLMQIPEVRRQFVEMRMRHYTEWLDTNDTADERSHAAGGGPGPRRTRSGCGADRADRARRREAIAAARFRNSGHAAPGTRVGLTRRKRTRSPSRLRHFHDLLPVLAIMVSGFAVRKLRSSS